MRCVKLWAIMIVSRWSLFVRYAPTNLSDDQRLSTNDGFSRESR